ncbi:MAG: Crp/Fnr family transcriptional regulator [Bacilli bacterium]|nr:Crp/Fnr family transcriptional regulator [Bacilli bacterium]
MKDIVKLITKNSGIKYDEVTAKKNQTLFFEGDECKEIGLIISGKVSIISYFSDGQEVIYNTLSRGEMFGNNLIFSSHPFYRGDVVAIEDSIIAYITKEELLKAMSENVGLLEQYLKSQADFSKQLNLKIKLLTINNAKDRIRYFLAVNKNEYKYRSITKLAKELYLTRETVSRTIYKMEKDKEIKIENKTIKLKS